MSSAVKSLRNVSSTRAPAAHLVEVVDVGELHRQPAAAVEVDHREHHRRARRVREAVDGEGDDRADGVGHGHGGGVARLRREVHLAGVVGRADEAELPVARPAGRRWPTGGPARAGAAARPAARRASAGRCRSRSARRPRPARRRAAAGGHDGERLGGPEEQHVGAVGERHERDDLARASRRLERGGEQERRVARRRCCRRRRRSRRRGGRRAPSFLASAALARPWVPATTTRSTWSATRPACFSASSHAAWPSGT